MTNSPLFLCWKQGEGEKPCETSQAHACPDQEDQKQKQMEAGTR